MIGEDSSNILARQLQINTDNYPTDDSPRSQQAKLKQYEAGRNRRPICYQNGALPICPPCRSIPTISARVKTKCERAQMVSAWDFTWKLKISPTPSASPLSLQPPQNPEKDSIAVPFIGLGKVGANIRMAFTLPRCYRFEQR